jgi:hypothetical protein
MPRHGQEKSLHHHSPRKPDASRRPKPAFGHRLVLRVATGVIVLAALGWSPSADGRLPRTAVLDDDRFPATLQRIEPDWQLVVQSDGQTRRLAAENLAHWGTFRDSDRGPQIVLTDGSWLTADVLQIDAQRLQVVSSLWGDFSVPRASTRGVIFNPSVDPAVRDRIRQQILEAQGARDLLWLENGDVVAGRAQRLIEEPTGPDDLAVSLVFATGGREVPLPLNKITALVFNPSQSTLVPPRDFHVLLGLADGSRLAAKRIDPTDGIVRLTLLGGVPLTIDPPSLWETTVFVQPLHAGIVYVSDLQSASYKHIPLLTRTIPQGRDSNPQGGWLRSGGNLHAKGLGMPSASRAAYALRGQYRGFAAEVALDDAAGPSGSVVFRVFLSDDQGGWQAAWESPPVRSGDPPLPVSVDLRGVQAMALIVDMGQRGDVQDYAVWLNARLINQE